MESLLEEYQYTIQALVAVGTVGAVIISLVMAYLSYSSRFSATLSFWYADGEITPEKMIRTSYITLNIINHSHHTLYFSSHYLIRFRIPFTWIYREFTPKELDTKYDEYIELPPRKMHVMGFRYFSNGLHQTIASLIPTNKALRWLVTKFFLVELVSANRVVRSCRLGRNTRKNIIFFLSPDVP